MFDLSAALAIDTDNDGISDLWEFAIFGSLETNRTNDSDGDGLPDWVEFQMGTNPLNPNSTLRVGIMATSNARIQLRWPSAAGVTFQVEKASRIEGPWTPASSLSSSGSDGLTFDNGAAAEFYRIVLKP